MNILELNARKAAGEKLVMLTCYDYWSAKLLHRADVDMLLVGDSLAMVMYGHSSTLPADTEMMARHTEMVSRGAVDKFIVSDLPFLSYRGDLQTTMDAVGSLMRAGAQAVKLEGIAGNEACIAHIVQSGVPVMAHLGLTPQSVNTLGGFKVQARDAAASQQLLQDARKAEALGCFSLVLECVPAQLAASVSEALTIPVIGIGAGAEVDGQVLVLHDMLGLSGDFKPKFLRRYLNGDDLIVDAINQYSADTRSGDFPAVDEAYS